MDEITSMKRIINSLQFKEGDRIPFFLFPTIHGASSLEDIEKVKSIASNGSVPIIGNLSVTKMNRWSKEDVKIHVKNIIAKAGHGGGLVIAPDHGDIPLQVSSDTLLNIYEAVLKWGKYPLDWVE